MTICFWTYNKMLAKWNSWEVPPINWRHIKLQLGKCLSCVGNYQQPARSKSTVDVVAPEPFGLWGDVSNHGASASSSDANFYWTPFDSASHPCKNGWGCRHIYRCKGRCFLVTPSIKKRLPHKWLCRTSPGRCCRPFDSRHEMLLRGYWCGWSPHILNQKKHFRQTWDCKHLLFETSPIRKYIFFLNFVNIYLIINLCISNSRLWSWGTGACHSCSWIKGKTCTKFFQLYSWQTFLIF